MKAYSESLIFFALSLGLSLDDGGAGGRIIASVFMGEVLLATQVGKLLEKSLDSLRSPMPLLTMCGVGRQAMKFWFAYTLAVTAAIAMLSEVLRDSLA